MDSQAHIPEKAYKQNLNADLLARLTRPLYRPGVIAAEPGRRIMARIQRRNVPPPLLDRLSQRQQPLADVAVQRQPIVFAQEIRAPEPAEDLRPFGAAPLLSSHRQPVAAGKVAGTTAGLSSVTPPVVQARLLQRAADIADRAAPLSLSDPPPAAVGRPVVTGHPLQRRADSLPGQVPATADPPPAAVGRPVVTGNLLQRQSETRLFPVPSATAAVAHPAQPPAAASSAPGSQLLQRKTDPAARRPAPITTAPAVPFSEQPVSDQVQRVADPAALPTISPVARTDAAAGEARPDIARAAAGPAGVHGRIRVQRMPASPGEQSAADMPRVESPFLTEATRNTATTAGETGTMPTRSTWEPVAVPTIQRQPALETEQSADSASAPRDPATGQSWQEPHDQQGAAGATRGTTAPVQRLVLPAGRQLRRRSESSVPAPAAPDSRAPMAMLEQPLLRHTSSSATAEVLHAASGSGDATKPVVAPQTQRHPPVTPATAPAVQDVPVAGAVRPGQVQRQAVPSMPAVAAHLYPTRPEPDTRRPAAAQPVQAVTSGDTRSGSGPVARPQVLAAASNDGQFVGEDSVQLSGTTVSLQRVATADQGGRQAFTSAGAGTAGRPLVRLRSPGLIERQVAPAAGAALPAQFVVQSQAKVASLSDAHAPLPTPINAGTGAPAALQRSPATMNQHPAINRAVSGTDSSANSTANSAGGPEATSVAPAAVRTVASPGDIDLERVADQVYQRLLLRLSSEREQRGW